MLNNLFDRRKKGLDATGTQQNLLLEELMREDWNSFRDRTPGNDRFYLAGLCTQGVTASSIVPTDQRLSMYALIVPVRSRIVEYGICKTVGAGATPIQLGIYQATSQLDLRPRTLLASSGVISTTAAGFYSINPNLVLDEGVLYYAAFLRQGGAALGFAHATGQTWSIWGYDRPGVTVTQPVNGFGVPGLGVDLMPQTIDPATLTSLLAGSPVPMLHYQLERV